MKYNYKLSPQ